MIEIRHLVITVVSVFLALILGILIGVGFSNPVQLQEMSERFRAQVQLIDDRRAKAQQDSAAVRDENQRLTGVLEQERKSLRSLLPVIVDARLAGHSTALIQTSFLKDFSFKDQVTQAIQKAGGTVAATIVLRPALLKLEGQKLQTVLETLEVGPIAPEQAVPKICRQLTKLVLGGDPANRVRALIEAGVMEVSGSCEAPVGSVVVVGGADATEGNFCETIDLPILAVCQETGRRCVAAEPETVPVSYMGPYQTVQATTVDNVDHLLGQISLVYALAGAEGNFGVKESASEVLPTKALEAASAAAGAVR